jgi:hypothetical protein
MPRPQFTLRALLVAMLVVAAFFGGMAVQRQLNRPVVQKLPPFGSFGMPTGSETMTMPDGSQWLRIESNPK